MGPINIQLRILKISGCFFISLKKWPNEGSSHLVAIRVRSSRGQSSLLQRRYSRTQSSLWTLKEQCGRFKVSLLSTSSLPFYYQPDPLPRYHRFRVLFFNLGNPMVSTSSRQYFAGLGNKGCSHSQEQ